MKHGLGFKYLLDAFDCTLPRNNDLDTDKTNVCRRVLDQIAPVTCDHDACMPRAQVTPGKYRA